MKLITSALIIAAAIVFHAYAGRYQINDTTPDASVTRLDRLTGRISFCNPKMARVLRTKRWCLPIEELEEYKRKARRAKQKESSTNKPTTRDPEG